MATQDRVSTDPGCVLRWRLTVCVGVVLLGLLRLGYPLGGDQALFLSYAIGLDTGARLYVDLWDNKQPGVFWFYLIAGKLFGFTALGVHLFEFFWLAGAAWLLWAAARSSLAAPLASELVPILTVGLYYWWASAWYMTQVEILVGLPLAGCTFLAVKALTQPEVAYKMHLLFGFCTAAVVTFKLVLSIVPLTMWLTLCLLTRRTTRFGLHTFVVRVLLPAMLGALVPLVVIALYFVQSGSWSAFFWANFVYPQLALREVEGKALTYLFRNAAWLVLMTFPVAVFVLVKFRGLWIKALRPIEALALVWFAAGFFAIAVQRFSWWGYHYLLLLPPLGLIAASLFDRYLATAGSGRDSKRSIWCLDPLVLATVVAMFLIVPRNSLIGLGAAVTAVRSPAGERIERFRTALDSRYGSRIEETAFLRDSNSRDGAIYVFGDPNWLLQANRPQALPIHGWAWEFMLDQQWADLPKQLNERRPVYIFLDAGYIETIEQRSPKAAAFIRGEYEALVKTSSSGVWYALKADR